VPAALPVIPFHLKFTQGEGDNKESVLDYEFTTHDLVIHISSLVDSIAAPGSGAFLPLGSGMGRKSRSGSGIRIRDEHPKSYMRELRSNFVG
jgi:hypothetical protein